MNASEKTGTLEKHNPSIYEDACKPLITPRKNVLNPDGYGVGGMGGGVGFYCAYGIDLSLYCIELGEGYYVDDIDG